MNVRRAKEIMNAVKDMNSSRPNSIKKEYKECKTITRVSGVKVKSSQDPKKFEKFILVLLLQL